MDAPGLSHPQSSGIAIPGAKLPEFIRAQHSTPSEMTAQQVAAFKTKGGVGSMMPMNMFLSYMRGTKGPSGFGSTSTAEEVSASWDGKGKVAIVTGAAAGLGETHSCC